MPYHILSAPCLRIIQDNNSGLTSLMDLVDTVPAGPNNKLTIPPFKLFSKWGKSLSGEEKEQFDIKLMLSGPSFSRKKQLDNFSVEIPEKASGVTIILEMGAIDLDEAGLWFVHITYKMSSKRKWNEACVLPFMVQEKKQKNTEHQVQEGLAGTADVLSKS